MTTNVATINLAMLASQAKPTTYKIYQTTVASSPGHKRTFSVRFEHDGLAVILDGAGDADEAAIIEADGLFSDRP